MRSIQNYNFYYSTPGQSMGKQAIKTASYSMSLPDPVVADTRLPSPAKMSGNQTTRFSIVIERGDPGSALLSGDPELLQNYPNPFSVTTNLRFSLPEPDDVVLEVFDMLGRRVGTLVHDHFEAGVHTVVWEPDNLAGGVYFYRIRSGGHVSTKKMVLLR